MKIKSILGLMLVFAVVMTATLLYVRDSRLKANLKANSSDQPDMKVVFAELARELTPSPRPWSEKSPHWSNSVDVSTVTDSPTRQKRRRFTIEYRFLERLAKCRPGEVENWQLKLKDFPVDLLPKQDMFLDHLIFALEGIEPSSDIEQIMIYTPPNGVHTTDFSRLVETDQNQFVTKLQARADKESRFREQIAGSDRNLRMNTREEEYELFRIWYFDHNLDELALRGQIIDDPLFPGGLSPSGQEDEPQEE